METIEPGFYPDMPFDEIIDPDELRREWKGKRGGIRNPDDAPIEEGA